MLVIDCAAIQKLVLNGKNSHCSALIQDIAILFCSLHNTYNFKVPDRKQADHKTVNWRTQHTTGGQTDMVLMELIVDLVREVTLSGPEGADSGPDLPILHTAQPLSCCNYLSHSERVGFGGRGVVGDNTCT